MAKKKKKGKKGKGKKKEQTDQITEVERELFLIQITDLTAKVERLKARCLELEASNVEYEENLKTLDEDRGDVITYLRAQSDQKQDEIEELEERVEGLVRARENDVIMYKEIINQNEHDFKIMHEQLTSEIKLLSGKLNSLEDFRIQRDDLVKKFKTQEDQMGDQEEQHKQKLYEVEKKFIIAKDKLKKEMEGKLLQLSSNFSDATEIRIAATTHHAIRENIAINNELDLIIATHNRLTEENDRIKQHDRQLRQKYELVEEEKTMLLKRNSVLVKLLNRLAKEYQDMEIQLALYAREAQINETCQFNLERAEEELKQAQYETRIETQKLHGALYEQEELRARAEEAKLEGEQLRTVINQCVGAIQEVMSSSEDHDEDYTQMVMENILPRLLQMMDLSALQYISVPTASIEKSLLYEAGDLGLVPKTSLTSLKSAQADAKSSSVSLGTKVSGTTEKSSLSISRGSHPSRKSSSTSSKSATSKGRHTRPSEDMAPNKSSLEITESQRPSSDLQIPGGRKSTRKTTIGMQEIIEQEVVNELKEPKDITEDDALEENGEG